MSMVYPILVLILVSVALLMSVRHPRTIYLRRLAFPALCVIFTVCLVIFSETAAKAALKGLNLWAAVVVPSLFPFFAASELLNSSGFTYMAGTLLEPVMRPLFNLPGCSSLALALGVTSGYPVGAKVTADLRKNKAITKSEAERLLAFTNNSGPLFIIGAVGTGMLGSQAIGHFLFICHLLACLTVGFVFRFYRQSEKTPSVSGNIPVSGTAAEMEGKKHPIKSFDTGRQNRKSARTDLKMAENTWKNPGTLLADAVRNSVSSILSIGGFIVLFSVVISFLEETGLIRLAVSAVLRLLPEYMLKWDMKGVISGVLSGLLEITTGTGTVSQCVTVPLHVKLPAVSFIIGWAGLSVHLQVMGIISGTDINIRPYLLGKMLQGTAAAIYAWVGLSLLPPGSVAAQPALGLPALNIHVFVRTMGRSVLILAVVIALWVGIFSLISLLKAMKKKSPI